MVEKNGSFVEEILQICILNEGWFLPDDLVGAGVEILKPYLVQPGTLYFNLLCPLSIVHFALYVAIFGVGLLLVELEDNFLVCFVVYCFDLAVKVDV